MRRMWWEEPRMVMEEDSIEFTTIVELCNMTLWISKCEGLDNTMAWGHPAASEQSITPPLNVALL